MQVEHCLNNEWLALDLNIKNPGFDIFTYALFTCQHMYFRLNAAERNLTLASSKGFITIGTDSHRVIQSLNVEFTGTLKSGTATDDTVDYIKDRMQLYPVSINLKNIADNNTSVSFVS